MSLRNTLVLGVAGIALATALPSSAHAQAAAQPRTLGYPQTGVVLGNGWDSQSVQKTSLVCIEFDAAQSQTGQETTAERTLVSDKYSYASALNISADVQVKSASGVAVDAKASYASKKQLSSTEMTVVDMVTVNNGWVYVAPKGSGSGLQAAAPPHGSHLAERSAAEVQHAQQVHRTYAPYFHNLNARRNVKDRNKAFAAALQRMYLDASHASRGSAPSQSMSILHGPLPTPPAPLHLRGATPPRASVGSTTPAVRLTDEMAALSQSNPDEFRRRCGDGFVSAIQQGGELAVTYTFLTSSQQEQQEIGASLGVSYGTPVASGSATVSVSQAISESDEKISTSITYYKTGGSGDPIPTDLDAIDGVTRNFAASVRSAPYSYQITVTDYRVLPNYGSSLGMPELTGFDLLAWEYGKAQTLYTSASDIITDLNKTQAGGIGNYLTARWGHSMAELQQVQRQAGSRLGDVVAVARRCVQASPAQSAQSCQIQAFDDLAPRHVFPLPIGPGNVSDVASALWGDDQNYQSAVFNRWVGQLNDSRCYNRPGDPLFCKYDADLASVKSQIRFTAAGGVALELVDKPGQCLNYGTVNSYLTQQPCPSSVSSSRFFFRYDPKAQRLHPASNSNQCILAVRIKMTVTPGYGVTGLADCNAQNYLEDINRSWEMRNSVGRDGKPDNTGLYMVVADPGTPQTNSCLDSTSNTSAWVAPCSHPMRVRFWMIAPN